MENNNLRYTSWNKPGSTIDKPDLILYNGTVVKHGTGGGYHFIFKNGQWEYIIENNLMGETDESMGIFLRLLKNKEEKLYTKMTNLKKKL
ncbi:hypothetical protein [Winogradskyella sp. MIT101101]|uniref:hypothetical protein n=1 Tax=Winogradskyella sp. MIT101101 TaxID=3098297 RepID=UPI0039994B9D